MRLTRSSPEADRWLRRYTATPDASATVVCFPHAGGAATYFHRLSTLLAPDIALLAVQYPGRQERRLEPLAGSTTELADRVGAILPAAVGGDGPVAFFGHSMGAIVAYETALRLERDHPDHAPDLLVASGRRAPSTSRPEQIHRLPDPALVDHVIALGGPSARVLHDPEMRELLLPAIRGDYRVVETYRPDPGAVLSAPVTVLYGDEDHLVSREEAEAWQVHTTGPTEFRTFPGGHFYLSDAFPAIAESIRAGLLRQPPTVFPEGIARPA